MKLPHALQFIQWFLWEIQLRVCGQIIFLSATVKELLKSSSICESYAQMKKGQVF